MEDRSLISQKEKARGLPRLSSSKKRGPGVGAMMKWSIAFLILVLAVTSGLFAWRQMLENQAQALEEKRQAIVAERDKALEMRVKNLDAVIDAYETLLVQHRNWTRLFDILEENTLSVVTFIDFSGMYNEGTIELSGAAPSYAAVAEQIRAFEQAEGFTAVNVNSVELNEVGDVGFNMTTSFAKNNITGAPTR